MALDDRVRDRQSQAGAGFARAALVGVERLEHVLEHVGRDAAAIVRDRQLDPAAGAAALDDHFARAGRHRLERVDRQIEQDLLHLVGVGDDLEGTGVGLVEIEPHLAIAVVLQAAGHQRDFFGDVDQRQRLAAFVAAACEAEQLLGGLLTPEGFVADDLEGLGGIIGGGVAVEGAEALERQLGVAGDHVERVVNLVGHPSGEEPDAGEALGADQLAAFFADLGLELLVEPGQLRGHAVEFAGQLGELAAAAGLEPPLELPRRQRPHPTSMFASSMRI